MTSVAMIEIWTIILMFVGMWFLINDTNKLDNVTTVVKATHIIKVIYRFPVTARAEQIPRICKAIGLSLNIGFKSTSFALDIF